MRIVALYAVVALTLIVPFALREASSELEAYPAVLLPAGAGKVNVGDESMFFSRASIFAFDEAGGEEELDPRAFFGDIPVQYWQPIARNHFGVFDRSVQTKTFRRGKWSLSATRAIELLEEDREVVKQWIGQRLEAIGKDGAVGVIVRIDSIEISKSSGEILSVINEYERTYFAL